MSRGSYTCILAYSTKSFSYKRTLRINNENCVCGGGGGGGGGLYIKVLYFNQIRHPFDRKLSVHALNSYITQNLLSIVLIYILNNFDS